MPDVVVIGAGPAGCAAAMSSARLGLDVLLMDAATFPRDKVCGDGIAPHALDVYAALGFDTATLTAGSTPVTTLRLRAPAGGEVARTMRRPAFVVRRRDFDDRLLAETRAAGVEVVTHRARRITVRPGAVDVDGVAARVVIGADGAESVVRRAAEVGAPPAGTVALAVRGYAPDPGPIGEQYLALAARRWPAYGWTFPIGDGTSNVGYGELLQGATPPNRASLLERMRALLPGVEPAQLRGHRLPLSTGRVRPPDGRLLLVGDAAGLVNPLSGEGITYAAVSGTLAGAAAVCGAGAGAALRQALGRRLGTHLRHTGLTARLGRRQRWIDAAVGAAAARQRCFDTFVDLALGDGRLDLPTALGLLRGAHLGLAGR